MTFNMTRLIRNIVFLLAIPSLSWSADYHIGAGQTYANIAAFDWRSLTAGDHVYIHSGTYKEMIWLSRSGTAENPIVIEGVPDGEGNLPVLDGDDMVIPPAYDGHLSEYDLGGGKLSQGYGMVFFHWSIQDAFGSDPQYITVKNFEIKNTTPELYTFTNSNGAVQIYPSSNAGAYVKTGQHITLENLVIHNVGNGIDSQGVDEMVRDLVIRGCWIYDFGRTDSRSMLEHGMYNEASGLLAEHNIIGPGRVGMQGSAIKDRGAGFVLRYNIVYSALRLLDLVEPENQSSYDCDGTDYTANKMHDEPDFRNSYVYGNIFINRKVGNYPAGSYLMHYGYDNCPDITRDGTLHFYNNTIIHDRAASEAYNSSLFDLAPEGTVNVYNNNILNLGTSNFHMAYHSKSTLSGTYNWLGGNYVSRPYQDIRTGYTAIWNETVPIIDGNVSSGVVTDAAANDASIPVGSPLIGAGVDLPTFYTTAGHPVDKQYLAVRSTEARADTDDIGAFLYDGVGPTCDGSHLNLCDETECGGAGGYWCGGVCQATSCPPGPVRSRWGGVLIESVETAP